MKPELVIAVILLIVKCTKCGLKSDQTLVNFRDPKIRKLLESTVSVAKICAMESHASPLEVRAYFTNSEPNTKNGECFVACIYERSKFIKFDKINPSRMIELATQVNGPESRVVKKLKQVTDICLMSVENKMERCLRATTYNNCINGNMREFAFPEDIADSIIAQIPFSLTEADRLPYFLPYLTLNRVNITCDIYGPPDDIQPGELPIDLMEQRPQKVIRPLIKKASYSVTKSSVASGVYC